MTTTPTLWKSQTQVNTTDGGTQQDDGQIVALQDGGYVVVWTDEDSHAYNPAGGAIVGQRYDVLSNKVGGEVKLSGFITGYQFAPAVTLLSNGNIAVAFVDARSGDRDIYVRIFDPSLDLLRVDPIDTGASQTFDPSITALAGGGYAVSYTLQNSADTTDTDIVARVVSSTGTVGAQFYVDDSSGSASFSEAATLSDGNFMVVNHDENQVHGIHTQYAIFSPTGALLGTQSRLVDGIRKQMLRRFDLVALPSCGPTRIFSPATTTFWRPSPTTPALLSTSALPSTPTRSESRMSRMWWGWRTAASS
jgi:hypothetical protein